jgi:primary-amine oxidase
MPSSTEECCHAETAASATEVLPVTHPLDPLTPAEITKAAALARRASPYGDNTRFEVIELKEPDKAVVRAFRPGAPIARDARVNVFSAEKIGVCKLILSLDREEVLFKKEYPTMRATIQTEEFLQIESIIRRDPAFIAGCAKRGITNMEMVCIDPWSAGNFGIPGEEGKHLCHVFAWLRLREFENFYAHPIEGLNAVIDLKTWKVIRVDDYGVVPIPMQEINYESQFITPRPASKPIHIVQPEGVNFKIEGHRLTWENWSMIVGFNSREGLTLHDIRFDDRPVLFRASIVEMVVPYGSPDNGHFRKHVFDVGEYGMGKFANSLKLGCDCLGVIEYLDVFINTMTGVPLKIEKAICIHEEDSGLQWKHMDFRTEHTEVRRARKLVVSFVCTVGNYEYAFYWYFHRDGNIECEVKATGVINTAACLPGHPGKYGREVSPGLVGQIHQHLFCARLDLAIDGDKNSFVECNCHAEPAGPANPYGNAFYEEETILRSEKEAARRNNPATQRYWRMINPEKKNHVGQPVGYKLDAPHCITPFVHPDSFSGKRAGFVQNHVWVTAYDSEERYPAGDYMNHSDGQTGLDKIILQDRPIENTDIVLWHTFGLHHPVRAEDFPVQPCVMSGFMLMPTGFFPHNPTINLPPETNAQSCCAHARQ